MNRQSRILIVDDEKSIRHTLGQFIRGEGHQVVEAEDADTALHHLTEGEFDVVVTDIILPRVTGLELLRRIRDIAPHVQVVIMTGEPTVETASEAVRAGAADYLYKPITKEAIIRAVANAVRMKSLHDFKNQLGAENLAYQENLERLVDERTSQLRVSEQQASELSRFNQAALDALTAHICVLDEAGRILAVNRGWMDFAAANPPSSAATGIGANYLAVCDAVTGEDQTTAQAVVRGLRAVARGDLSEFFLEYPCHSPDAPRWFTLRATRFAGEGPAKVVVAHVNITEQKQLQAQFLRAQRMESVGRLAGGIAHDLNNILSPILVGASLLREGLPPAAASRLFDTIGRSAQRGADIVKQLLTFARGTEGVRVPLPPSRPIMEMARVVRETFPKSITLHSECPMNLWPILGNPTQLDQVLLNLCVNARDAMPDGGTLTLTAANMLLDDCYSSLSPEAKAGPHVVLEVADTGTGIPQDIVDKIFDPFFTTKGPEMGTGLGLSTVHGIVKGHGGFIQVESKVGRGSRFKVFLPAHPAEEAAATPAPGRELPQGQGELVLVVDDELNIRNVIMSLLENHGYHVLTANDGTGAIALYVQHQAEIKVVLTDMMMPVMDGASAVRVLRGINPHVKIIAASGYASNVSLAKLADVKVEAYLPKPFTSEQLLGTLERVLRADGTPLKSGE